MDATQRTALCTVNGTLGPWIEMRPRWRFFEVPIPRTGRIYGRVTSRYFDGAGYGLVWGETGTRRQPRRHRTPHPWTVVHGLESVM